MSPSPRARRLSQASALPATATGEGADSFSLVIEDKGGGTQPPDLTENTWDHGLQRDGGVQRREKRDIAPDFFMQPFDP